MTKKQELREAIISQVAVGLNISRRKAEKFVDEWLMPMLPSYCYLIAEGKLPQNPYNEKTQPIPWDVVYQYQKLLTEVDGVAYRACEEFKDETDKA